MSDAAPEALIISFLEWLVSADRTYQEVMEAWRTSCPRLPVWEDANDRGLVSREHVNGRTMIKASPSGLALLEHYRDSRRSDAARNLSQI